jgi:deoxyribodipyrimidine photo-lyase
LFYNNRYGRESVPTGQEDLKSSETRGVLTPSELEQGRTHDPTGTAQKEMMLRGKMHGYMRMYWGKRSSNGADPQGLSGPPSISTISTNWTGKSQWIYRRRLCFRKHDRPWGEKIFSSIRYMNEGLRGNLMPTGM